MTDVTLWGEEIPVRVVFPKEKRRGGRDDRDRTPAQRRKARQQEMLARGMHPTGTQARPELGTCGTCAHLRRGGSGNSGGRFLKCGLYPITSGPGTDIRAGWPACVRYTPAGVVGSDG